MATRGARGAVCTALAAVWLAAIPARAQPVVGLLEIPELFGTRQVCGPFEAERIVLYERPSTRAAVGEIFVARPATNVDPSLESCTSGPEVVVRMGRTVEPLLTDEHGYEEVSAVVIETFPGWYRVRTGTTLPAAWVRASPRMQFRSLEVLLVDSLTSLDESWDGRVWDKPGGRSRQLARSTLSLYEYLAVSVFEVRQAHGRWWARVETAIDVCSDDAVPPRSLRFHGWVELYPQGTPHAAVWFASRGC